jgi:hypothetical protein
MSREFDRLQASLGIDDGFDCEGYSDAH